MNNKVFPYWALLEGRLGSIRCYYSGVLVRLEVRKSRIAGYFVFPKPPRCWGSSPIFFRNRRFSWVSVSYCVLLSF